MTIEKFYETLNFVLNLDRELGLQSAIDSIASTLTNLVNAPAQPAHQSNLASYLQSFATLTGRLEESISVPQQSAIKEIGGQNFFSPWLSNDIQASITAHAMTPSVARDFVQDLATRRSQFLSTAERTRAGLQELGVSEKAIAAGTADMAFLIPRDLFGNDLGSFSKELNFIDRLIRDFSEAATGEIYPAVLEGEIRTVSLTRKTTTTRRKTEHLEKTKAERDQKPNA